MTPKEKAIEVYFKMLKWQDESNLYIERNVINTAAKRCALIAIDEILENVDYFFKELEKDNLPNKFNDEIEYWNEVKQEIENL